MKANVGAIDRVLRIALGLVLLSAVVLADGAGRWLGLIGVVPLATGILGRCPLYSVLGLSTCATQRPKGRVSGRS